MSSPKVYVSLAEEVTLDLVLLPFGIIDISIFPVMGIVSFLFYLFIFFFRNRRYLGRSDKGKKREKEV